MTFTNSVASNNFGCAKWIVSATVGQGTHQTIATALTSASSGDTIFIRPGTYTENLTLKAGVNLTAWQSDSSLEFTNGNVIISGKCTFTGSGIVNLSGITLQTNSDFALAITGSSASRVICINCNFQCTNNTGISFTSSSASALCILAYCSGDIGTTGIALFSHSSAGKLTIRYSLISNSGSTLTQNTCSAGTTNLFTSYIANGLTYSGTGTGVIKWCEIGSSNNATALTTANNHEIYFSKLSSGSSTPFSCGGTVTVNGLILDHTNATAISGSGTLLATNIMQTQTVGTISAPTWTPKFTSGALKDTAPPPGMLGERLVDFRTQASLLSLSNNTPANNNTLVLTAGVWDLTLLVGFSSPTVTPTLTQMRISINNVSATLSGTIGDSDIVSPGPAPVTGVANNYMTIPGVRVLVPTAGATYYGVVQAQFSAGNISSYGRLSAVRVA